MNIMFKTIRIEVLYSSQLGIIYQFFWILLYLELSLHTSLTLFWTILVQQVLVSKFLKAKSIEWTFETAVGYVTFSKKKSKKTAVGLGGFRILNSSLMIKCNSWIYPFKLEKFCFEELGSSSTLTFCPFFTQQFVHDSFSSFLLKDIFFWLCMPRVWIWE